MELVTSGSAWIALLTLTILQIILGVDNIVLLTVLTGSLPKAERSKAHRLGVIVATWLFLRKHPSLSFWAITDELVMTITAGTSSTGALSGSTEEEQFQH